MDGEGPSGGDGCGGGGGGGSELLHVVEIKYSVARGCHEPKERLILLLVFFSKFFFS